MSASRSSLAKFTIPQSTTPHLHLSDDICPLCEQPISHDRLDEINNRIEAREQQRTAEITDLLQEAFVTEKAQAVEQTQREAAITLNLVRQESEEKASLARKEGREAAEASAQERIAALEQASKETHAALQTQIEQVLAENKTARDANSTLQANLDEVRRENEIAIDKIKQDAISKESTIRQEASVAAEAAVAEKMAQLEKARIDAEAKTTATEQQISTLEDTHATTLAQRLQEQREALESARTEAVNLEKSTAFEEKMKLSSKVEELQRALDNKTAEELGEGAEIDLYETLKIEFDHDRIERIDKGQQGADILHTVFQNGKECGKIIYDSKNHNAWRNDFVTKLATDQMAAKAEHAVLSTRKFPADTRHLHVQDGVIVASPSRIVAIVQIIRKHIVQTHTLRLSNEARTQKTAELYSFITSERCIDLFKRIDTHAEDLLEIQVKEKKSHETTWKRQGELLRSVQKVRAELCNEIDTIIETGNVFEQPQ
jgi:hypothetical protein